MTLCTVDKSGYSRATLTSECLDPRSLRLTCEYIEYIEGYEIYELNVKFWMLW